VLGQTGALTDQNDVDTEQSIETVRAVLRKTEADLARVRAEARALNERRVRLAAIVDERAQTLELLEETRRTLDGLRLESGADLPGLTEIMQPAQVPQEPAEDNRKERAAMGAIGGYALALAMMLAIALTARRVRYSDDLEGIAADAPRIAFRRRDMAEPARVARRMDLLRNRIQLYPVTGPDTARTRIVSVLRLDRGSGHAAAEELAASFARARFRVLLIDADMTARADGGASPGWRDLIAGEAVAPKADAPFHRIGAGSPEAAADSTLSLPAIRRALDLVTDPYEVVVLSVAAMDQSVSAELCVSASDFAVVEYGRGDGLASVNAAAATVRARVRIGMGLVFTDAARGDPALRHA
jgi:hypothetical protein